MTTLTQTYDLELDRVCKEILKENAKLVCVQLPEGLRPRAKEITDSIRSRTGAEVILWAGSCYGACDVPTQVESLGVQLLIQWGHARWS